MQLTLTQSSLTLAPEPAPDQRTIRAIASGLDSYNALFTPLADWTPHWIIGRDESGAVQAGVQFITSLDWLFLRWLWVAEAHRKLGIGSQLLSSAEDAARTSNCRAAYVDMLTFQAPEFYERQGYREFARLTDFPRGHARIWLSKLL
jgi:GNAT superfamily N-acetyltransferase